MSMDFDSLVLSKADLFKLWRLSKHPVANNKTWARKLSALCELDFVGVKRQGTTSMLAISDEGIMYLRYIMRRQRELRFSNVLSIIAIVISLIALFR